ncbi:hypothetical protein ABPG74_019539 [Tetrahymena malaccensis]
MSTQKDCLQQLKANGTVFNHIQELLNYFFSNQNYSNLRNFENEIQQVKLVGRNHEINSDVVLIIANKSVQFKQEKISLSTWNLEINDFIVAEFDKNFYFRNIDLSQFSIEQIVSQHIEYPQLIEKYSYQRKQQVLSDQDAIMIGDHIAKFKNLYELTINLSKSIINQNQFQKLLEYFQIFSNLLNLNLQVESCSIYDLEPLENIILKLNTIQVLQLNLKGNSLMSGGYEKLCQVISQSKTIIEFCLDTVLPYNYANQNTYYSRFEQILSNLNIKKVNIQLGYKTQMVQTNQIVDQKKIYKLRCQSIILQNIFNDLLKSQEFQDHQKFTFDLDCDYQSQDLIKFLSLYRGKDNLKEMELILTKLDVKDQIQILEQIIKFKNIYQIKLSFPARYYYTDHNNLKVFYECIAQLQKLRVLNITYFQQEIKKKLFQKLLKIKRLVKCTFR